MVMVPPAAKSNTVYHEICTWCPGISWTSAAAVHCVLNVKTKINLMGGACSMHARNGKCI